jgi:hypothetical protein
MEYVCGRSLEALMDECAEDEQRTAKWFDMIANAIRLFIKFPVPDGAKPGLGVEASIIQHVMLKDQTATLTYDSVADLQNHLNKASGLIQAHGFSLVDRLPDHDCQGRSTGCRLFARPHVLLLYRYPGA